MTPALPPDWAAILALGPPWAVTSPLTSVQAE